MFLVGGVRHPRGMKRVKRRPALLRDHARPRNDPRLADPVVEARLQALVAPATLGLVGRYRTLGLRERLLTLPTMVAVVLALIWRQIPSVVSLVDVLEREGVLWQEPLTVSAQAISQRLRRLPAALFGELLHELLPTFQARAQARTRPLPAVLARLGPRYPQIWAVDVTVLEAVFKKVGGLREAPGVVLGGALAGVLDVVTKLPVQLWYEAEAAGNEQRFFDRLAAVLPAGALVFFDRGFWTFGWFDRLTDRGVAFVTRLRAKTAYTVTEVLGESEAVRDQLIRVGQYRSSPATHPLRLVEVCWGGVWHAYITNVLDPTALTVAEIVDGYARRWEIEEAFLIVKRLLGLSYLWTGAANGVALQCWATLLLYAVVLDLSDAVAQELDLPLDALSLEMVYRALYFYTVACRQGETADPVTWLARPAQRSLRLVKRTRPKRQRETLDKRPKELKL